MTPAHIQVLPIVTADIKHEKLEEMEAELKTAEERLQRSEAIYNEAQQRVAAVSFYFNYRKSFLARR